MKLTVGLAHGLSLLLVSSSVSFAAAGFAGAAFIVPRPNHPNDPPETDVLPNGRRALLQTAWTAAATAATTAAFSSVLGVAPAQAADTGAQVRGTPVNAFNGLTFQYRGNDFNGLRATDLEEPSISYRDFCEELKTGRVVLVEFLAPNGDVAYATTTLTNGSQQRIRIGEGYPIERHDGYSSPAFAIRTVQNAGVPYKFVVPSLAARP
jgi:hypothetical protein